MVNGFWGNTPNNGWDANSWNNQMWNEQVQYLPTQTNPTQYRRPVVSPTQQFVQTNVTNTVVPHVHPSHLTTVNRQLINNQHYFPQTQSFVNECFETNTMCGSPTNHCRPRHQKRCF